MGFFPGQSAHYEQTQDLHSLQNAKQQLSWASQGEGRRDGEACSGKKEQLLPPHPHPSQDVRAWALATDESARLPGGVAQVAKGVAALEPARHWLKGVLSPRSVGRAATQCPSSPGHRRSHSPAGYSAEAPEITGGEPGS